DVEEGRTSIWDMFARLFQNGQDMNFAGTTFPEQTTETDTTETGGASAYRLVFCLILLVLVVLVWIIVRKGLRMYHYHRANRSEKLLMKYQDMLRSRKKELYGLKSFEEQIAWLVAHGVLTGENSSAEKLVRTLNEAAYGPGEISVEAFEEMSFVCRNRSTLSFTLAMSRLNIL
ncbi:MAG: hypothetical protein K2K07_12590, partial [Lachnospiraceae bacterium]|nr:hypothetical protein [Lachnospiraceae bacterium]